MACGALWFVKSPIYLFQAQIVLKSPINGYLTLYVLSILHYQILNINILVLSCLERVFSVLSSTLI